jgi:hypothetical protein
MAEELDERDRQLLVLCKLVGLDIRKFAIDILTGDVSDGEQIAFAHELVELAEEIKNRVTGRTAERNVPDDHTPPRGTGRSTSPRSG